jgi:iron complex outermembrane receptor protein
VRGCYNSLNFATEPLCDLFTRNPAGTTTQFLIDTVIDDFLNIAKQHNRGLDFSAIYRTSLPVGDLSLKLEASRGLEVTTQLLPTSAPRDVNGEIGNPEWVGNLDVTYDIGKWSLFYGLRYVGGTSNVAHFGAQAQLYFQQPVRFVLTTDAYVYSNISVSRDLPAGMNLRLGVSNAFDQKPPFVTGQSGEYNAIGNVPLDGTQYDFFGRTVFVNLTKKF